MLDEGVAALWEHLLRPEPVARDEEPRGSASPQLCSTAQPRGPTEKVYAAAARGLIARSHTHTHTRASCRAYGWEIGGQPGWASSWRCLNDERPWDRI